MHLQKEFTVMALPSCLGKDENDMLKAYSNYGLLKEELLKQVDKLLTEKMNDIFHPSVNNYDKSFAIDIQCRIFQPVDLTSKQP